jgi:hypothetical protein
LQEEEQPTTRRLQARAAKSAVRRVQEIYDANKARAELATISDPVQRDRRALELQRLAADEVKQLAERLSELIPTDCSMDRSKTTPTQLFDARSFKRTSSNNYVMSSQGDDWIQALDRLLREVKPEKTYEIDYLNPMGDDSGSEDSFKDDEFVEEWEKRHLQMPGNVSNSEIDDKGSAIRTLLA